MPTYDYQCTDGHTFEKIHKMSESPRVTCPSCGKPAARQISGGAGLVFKGSGFYITDYGKDGKGARKAESPESTPAAAKAESAPATGSADSAPKAEPKTLADAGKGAGKPPKPGAS